MIRHTASGHLPFLPLFSSCLRTRKMIAKFSFPHRFLKEYYIDVIFLCLSPILMYACQGNEPNPASSPPTILRWATFLRAALRPQRWSLETGPNSMSGRRSLSCKRKGRAVSFARGGRWDCGTVQGLWDCARSG